MHPPAGWYPDPHDDRAHRYWDGERWTEAVRPAGPPAPPPPTGAGPGPTSGAPAPWSPDPWSTVGQQQAPFAVDGWQGRPTLAPQDVGDWLSASFQHVKARFGPLFLLLVVVQGLGVTLVAIPFVAVLRRVEIDTDDGSLGLDRLGWGTVGLAVVAGLIGVAVAITAWMAAAHQLHGAWIGRPSSAGRSLATGVRRLPRTVGWGLVGMVAYAVGLAAVAAVLFVLTGAGGLAVLGVFAFLGLLVVGVWLVVRLSLFPVALAVGPPGVNPYGQSWGATEERWWATLGRLILLGLLAAIVGFVFNVLNQVLLGEPVSVSVVGDDVFINGDRVRTGEIIRLGDLLPGTAWLMAASALSALAQGAQQAIQIAGMVGMYLQGGGRSEP